MEFLDKSSNFTIVQSINNSLTILWPEGMKCDKFLLLLMLCGSLYETRGQNIMQYFPKTNPFDCLAHAMHNVCENIMHNYSDVNRLVSCDKKIIVKSQSRKQLFREMFPSISTPPEPVRTQWGLWINAIEYYTKYFNNFVSFIEKLYPEESVHTLEVQKLAKNPSHVIWPTFTLPLIVWLL
jgi:hypothetical protein